jgi:hypothetical protein
VIARFCLLQNLVGKCSMLSLMLMYALQCGKCEIIWSLGKDDWVNKKDKRYSIFHVQGTGPTPGHDDQKGFGHPGTESQEESCVTLEGDLVPAKKMCDGRSGEAQSTEKISYNGARH